MENEMHGTVDPRGIDAKLTVNNMMGDSQESREIRQSRRTCDLWF